MCQLCSFCVPLRVPLNSLRCGDGEANLLWNDRGSRCWCTGARVRQQAEKTAEIIIRLALARLRRSCAGGDVDAEQR